MKGAVLLLLIAGVAHSLVVGYHTEPRTAGQSGWPSVVWPNNNVSQVVTVNFDELDSASGSYIQLFAGGECRGGAYYLTVLTYPGGSPVASAFGDHGDVDHKWVTFYLKNPVHPESIVRGKKLKSTFSLDGGDSAAT